MNRIAALLIVLLITALGLLLYVRSRPRALPVLDTAEMVARPHAALDRAEALVEQARLGVSAATRARVILETVAGSGSGTDESLRARLLLVELERLQGHDQAAADALLHAIQGHPDSEAAPRLLCEMALLLQDRLDRPTEARETLRRVYHLYPDSPFAAEARRLTAPAAPRDGSTTEGDQR